MDHSFDHFVEEIALLPPVAFEEIVAEILEATGNYRSVDRAVSIGPFEIDAAATLPRADGGAGPRTLFDVKRTQIVNAEMVLAEIRKRDAILAQEPTADLVFVTSGQLTAAAARAAREHALSVWGPAELYRRLTPGVIQRWLSARGARPTGHDLARKARALEEALPNIVAGRVDAVDYQEWVYSAMEFLFNPPIGPLHFESRDAANRNRRDIIVENWATDGFWALLRGEYSARQIVVDAKNYAEQIGKAEVTGIAHYLKRKGCGLLGILVSRRGSSEAAAHAAKEEWLASDKLILSLDDDSVLEMVHLRAGGAPPDAILKQRIAEFHRSL